MLQVCGYDQIKMRLDQNYTYLAISGYGREEIKVADANFESALRSAAELASKNVKAVIVVFGVPGIGAGLRYLQTAKRGPTGPKQEWALDGGNAVELTYGEAEYEILIAKHHGYIDARIVAA